MRSQAPNRQDGVRVADACQLGAGLVWCRERPGRKPFVCVDQRVATAAEAAGVALQCRLNQMVDAGAPLCSIHAESPGELDYAAAYAVSDGPIFGIEAL